MKKIKILLNLISSFKNSRNRIFFKNKLIEYLIGISNQSQHISSSIDKIESIAPLTTQTQEKYFSTEKIQHLPSPYNAQVMRFGDEYKILLVVHQFSRTGAPYAVLYLARAVFALNGIKPVVISPEDGPLRDEFEAEGVKTIVDPLLFNRHNYSVEACSFVASFERVIVTSLASYSFIRYFRGVAKKLSWWIHETDVGFKSVASTCADLDFLFAVCDSIWLGSPLSFSYSLKYAPKDKLHLLLYGCPDSELALQQNLTDKVIFSIIGSIEPRKGQDIFLKAVKLLSDEIREKALFRIIGSPLPFEASENFYKKILTIASKMQQVECLSNMPYEELQKYYAETDVVVSASRDDPMPIVVTQGLMFSKVCICSSAIGHAELIQNEKNGLIFSSESAEELADKMTWVVENSTNLLELRTAARSLFDEFFHMTSFKENLAKLLLLDKN